MTESFEGKLVRRRLPIVVVIGIAALAIAIVVVLGPSPFDTVTNNRTHSWIPILVPLLESGHAFVAVGSMHVDQGTLDLGVLLEREGFTVRRVN